MAVLLSVAPISFVAFFLPSFVALSLASPSFESTSSTAPHQEKSMTLQFARVHSGEAPTNRVDSEHGEGVSVSVTSRRAGSPS
eukprot:scaffold150818_cov44-Attheya_sp.AAC.1